MKQVSLTSLANELAKPGFERELIPLLMYKGHSDLGRMHRLWNLTVGMMMHEADSIGEGLNHLQLNPEWSQLCGPPGRVHHCGMRGFLNRMRDNKPVTDLVPGLTDYVAMILPRWYPYQRVPLEASSSRKAWWRTYTPKPRGPAPLPAPNDFYEMANGKSVEWAMLHYARSRPIILRWFAESEAEKEVARGCGVLAYPFLIHESKRPEHDLLRLINAAIPTYLHPDLRADMCQDLAVGCLTGDFDKGDLHLPAKEVVRLVLRMFPTKYGPVSLDDFIPGTTVKRIDTLVDEGRDWA